MSVAKTPAMPFYGKDAYDDETFSKLSWSAQALWLFLSWWQWQEGSIPEDPELIFDRMPRKKVREARGCWTAVEPLFPPSGDGRRKNPTTEKHRAKVAQSSEAKRRGAEKTNEKRWRSASLSDSVSDSLSDSLSTRSALHMHMQEGSLSQPTKNQEGVQGEDNFAVAERLSHKLEAAGFKYPPSDQIVVAWLSEGCDEKLILETLADCESEYRGKSYKYFESILIDRRDNPDRRPGNRLKRGQNGNGRSNSGASTAAADATPKQSVVERFGGKRV